MTRPVLTLEQIDAFINVWDPPETSSNGNGTGAKSNADTFIVDAHAYIAAHADKLAIFNEKPHNDDPTATVINLVACPFDSNHTNGDSALIQWPVSVKHPKGAVGFMCFHDSCKGKTIGDVRDVIEGSDQPKRGKSAKTINYASRDNRLFQVITSFDDHGEERTKYIPLTTFDAAIIAHEITDDGAETANHYKITGKLDTGQALPTLDVAAEAFSGMTWTAQWGPKAVVLAGMGIKDHARVAIQLLSDAITTQTVYTHMGWRKVGNRWLYLFAGGAIGADGFVPESEVCARLEGRMVNYRLELPEDGAALKAAVLASLALLEVNSDLVTVPLWASIYRAPLGALDTTPMLIGQTGAGKSAMAALAEQHYGRNWSRILLPENFSSTENAITNAAFLTKDALAIFDEYVPQGSLQDMQRMRSKAERLVRSVGNGQYRNRMTANLDERAPRPPRCLPLMTGEDAPHGQSLQARMLLLEVPRDSTSHEAPSFKHLHADALLASASKTP